MRMVLGHLWIAARAVGPSSRAMLFNFTLTSLISFRAK